MSNKQALRSNNYLCTLHNGREVHKGDTVYRTDLNLHVTAEDIYVDSDGDRYLVFEEGGNAWIDGPMPAQQKLR